MEDKLLVLRCKRGSRDALGRIYEKYKSSMTDSAGRFSYSTWPEEHTILAEAPGYKSQSKTITAEQFQSDKFAAINFSLEKQ